MLLMIENAVGEGFRTLGIGLMIVVGVLALLMAVLYLLIPLFKKIANKQPKKPKEQSAPPPFPQVPLVPQYPLWEEGLAGRFLLRRPPHPRGRQHRHPRPCEHRR